ncbi:peroxiredoxin [Erythrobacter sp. YT30]|uniref:peroxiredoxin n=1 Tax=Erythrobacter sp. YT30 TaxID=1735012 RepID=UPI00076C51BF|nr:peroxiredoxin [Erythrobacter sp. YT30]KWV92321.1 alkyl hydroperoxide reductase [Erythrobacter sp. YT30]
MSDFPGVGDAMPDIAMGTPDGGEVKPSEFEGKKLVIFFYPKDNTPGCTTEAKDFTALKPDFDAAGVELLGVSKDSAKKHQNFIAKHDLTTPLATDSEEDGLSDALGVWAEKQMYGKTYMGMVRSTYLVGSDGKIAQIWPKVKVKGHAEEVLAAAKAL